MTTARLTLLSPLALLAFASHANAEAPAAAAAATATASTVIVAGKRTDVINEIDRKVYRTDNDLQASSGSAADILNNIPSVDVDIDGNLSLRGDAGVTVLIDGQPSGQMQGKNRGAVLQALSAADIAQIEVITSPSAEFKPDGSGGIINIVTRKSRKSGRSTVLAANLGNDGRRNANLAGSVNTGPLAFDGNLDVRRDYRERALDTDTRANGGASVHSHQDEQSLKERVGARIGLKLTPNERQSLGLALDYATRQDRRSLAEHNGSASGPAYERSGTGGEPRIDGGASLSFEQKLAREGEAVSFYLQRSHSKETEELTADTRDAASLALAREYTALRQAFDVAKAALAYARPLDDGGKLKFGLDVQLDRSGFDNQRSAAADGAALVANPAFDSRFRYRQQVNAAYATWGHKLAQMELLAGLRYEQVAIDTRQLVSGERGAQTYGKLYPTLNLMLPLADGAALTGGFSRRVRKPDPEDLNPYINSANPKILRQGNSGLKPQITDALEIGYRREAEGRSDALTAYYRRSTNGDTDLLTPLSADVVLITKVNLPANQSGGLELTSAGKLLATLGYNASGNLFYNQIDSKALGVAGTRANVAANAKVALNYQPGAGDKLQLSANYRGKRLTPQGESAPVATMNIGYRRQWNSDLALVATVSDLFNSQRDRRLYQTASFEGTYRRHPAGQVAYLGLVYTFDGSKKAKESDFSYD